MIAKEEIRLFDQCFNTLSPENKKVQRKQYLPEGKIPVIDQGEDFIGGYTNDHNKQQDADLPVILFGDHTRRFKYVDFPFAVGADGIKILKPIDKTISDKFAYYQLTQKELPNKGYSRHYQFLRKVDFWVPQKRGVQEKIVETIETQFTRLDAAIKSLKAIKAKIKLFRISVLKATFDREWHYDKLGHLFKTTSGGTPSRSNKKYYTGTIPWLKSGELNDDKHIEDSEEHITQEAIDNSSAKKFPPNTVMIALYGATTGKLGILKKESTTNQAICGIFPQEGYITEFVFYFLLFKRAALISQGKGGAQPNISQGIVKDTDFPKADEKTQREVIDFVESQLSIIDKISDVVDASLAKAEKLRKSILKSAFEGKLVN